MNPWKRTLRIYLAAVFLVMGIPMLFMLIVDPYNISMWVTRPWLNAKASEISNQSRLAKAAAIIRHKPDTIIIGSSVADGGFVVPGSTYSYDINRAEHLHDYEKAPFIFNAGIRGGVIEDGLEMLKHAYANNPQLKHVIAGYEWAQFTGIRPITAMHDTEVYGSTMLFPFAYKKYCTWTAFDDALRTIEANTGISRDELQEKLKHPSKWIFGLSPISKADAAESPMLKPLRMSILSDYPVVAFNDPVFTHEYYFAFWYTIGLKGRLLQSGENGVIDKDALEVLRKIVAFTREKHITLTLYLSPQPPVFWEMVRKDGLWPYYEKWLKTVAEIYPYYDFSRYPEVVNDDAHKSFGGDIVHFLPTLGEKLLPALLRDSEQEHGAYYVTSQTVNADIASRTAELDTWLNANPAKSGLINKLDFASDKGNDDLASIIPTPFEPDFHGFRIIRHLHDQYFALPYSRQPYDLEHVINHDYNTMLTGASVDDLMTKIAHIKADK